MVSITCIAVAREPGVDGGTTLPGLIFALHDHVSGPFAEVQSVATAVERSANIVVENHQRVETIEMEPRQSLRTTGNNNIGIAGLQHIGTEDDGVSR